MTQRYSVRILKSAEADLIEILVYIEQNGSPGESDHVLALITEQLESLSHLPDRGHKVPELSEVKLNQFSEVHQDKFRFIYEVREGAVFIHAILDSRRKLQDLLFNRLMRS